MQNYPNGTQNPVYTQAYDPAPQSVASSDINKTVVPPNPSYVAPQATYAQPHDVVYAQQQQTVYAQQPYATYAAPQVQVVHGVSQRNNIPRPTPGYWGSQICDWPTNLFPSCYCSCCVCCGMWLVAQLAQKHQFADFKTVMTVYMIIVLISFILDIVLPGSRLIVIGPFMCSLVYSIILRIHIARKDRITECGSEPCCGECCIGFWCHSCSIAQMARYSYGYTTVLDGDANPDRPDNYAPLEPNVNYQNHVQV